MWIIGSFPHIFPFDFVEIYKILLLPRYFDILCRFLRWKTFSTFSGKEMYPPHIHRVRRKNGLIYPQKKPVILFTTTAPVKRDRHNPPKRHFFVIYPCISTGCLTLSKQVYAGKLKSLFLDRKRKFHYPQFPHPIRLLLLVLLCYVCCVVFCRLSMASDNSNPFLNSCKEITDYL